MGLTAEQKLANQLKKYQDLKDSIKTTKDLGKFLSNEGIEKMNLMLAYDGTISNASQGKKANAKNSAINPNLHHTAPNYPYNMYQTVTRLAEEMAVDVMHDDTVDMAVFGDATTNASSVRELTYTDPETGKVRHTGTIPSDLLDETYLQLAAKMVMGSPTTFEHIIDWAAAKARLPANCNQLNVLLLLADGLVARGRSTRGTYRALNDACDAPLVVICIGIGDGPWDKMKSFDDERPDSDVPHWDNFNFVQLDQYLEPGSEGDMMKIAVAALSELPGAWKVIVDVLEIV